MESLPEIAQHLRAVQKDNSNAQSIASSPHLTNNLKCQRKDKDYIAACAVLEHDQCKCTVLSLQKNQVFLLRGRGSKPFYAILWSLLTNLIRSAGTSDVDPYGYYQIVYPPQGLAVSMNC